MLGEVHDDAALANDLRQRYREFAEGVHVRLAVCVRVNGQSRTTSLLDISPVLSDGLVRFNTPGYEGLIDERNGAGWLTLSSAMPVEDVDYFLRVAFAVLAFRAGGLLFHAAGLVRDGRGYIFFGYSGSGKTTVARLSPDAVVLNDDLLLLLPAGPGRGWTVHATPFWNPSQVSPAGPLSAPLAAMFRLVQDRQVYLEDMEPGQALAELIASVPVISTDPSRLSELLERSRRLAASVQIARLHFLPDASFWSVVLACR